jgi:4,5-dihydroxyphthalate decarboxylase
VELLRTRPIRDGWKPFVGDSAIDVCEIAIITLLQAIQFGKPVALLPVATLARAQHQTLVTRKDLTLSDLPGKSVGLRSWSQTTAVWLRGILTSSYNVDLHAIDWVIYEDGDVAEYNDPVWVRRSQAGAHLADDFLSDRIDCAVLGVDLPDDDRTHPVILQPEEAGRQWAANAGCIPVNHVVAFSLSAARDHAEAICAMYDAMSAALHDGRDGNRTCVTSPAGFEALRAALSMAADFGYEQQVLPRRIDFDEIIAQTCQALGVPASRLGG